MIRRSSKTIIEQTNIPQGCRKPSMLQISIKTLRCILKSLVYAVLLVTVLVSSIYMNGPINTLLISLEKQSIFNKYHNKSIDDHSITPLIRRPSRQSEINRLISEFQQINNDSNTMVTATASGRLGNVMFIYASLLGIALTNHKRPWHHLHQILKMFPDIDMVPTQSKEIIDRTSKTNIVEKGCCVFEQSALVLNKTMNYQVIGFRQSWKYFPQLFDLLRERVFRFDASVKEKCTSVIESILMSDRQSTRESCIVIGAHMRRGDMTGHNDFFAAEPVYLRKALTFYRKKFHKETCVHFIIIGDDVRWNKAVAPRAQDITISYARDIDLCILAHCNHTIMSTGTFGWWGAFLANGLVTYQKEFAKNGSRLYREYEPNDFYLPQWIPLSIGVDFGNNTY